MGRSKKNWDHLVDHEGNYYDLTNALGPKGPEGQKGDPGQKGDRGRIGRRGLKGEPGSDAPPLLIWKGRVPTEADLPQAVPGTNGWTYQAEDTKYFYVSNADGTYTEVQNLDLIKGEAGEDGATAYELALDNGFSGTEAEWLESLKGEKGETGDEGKSAYEVAQDNGFTGTEPEWLESLEAEDGVDGDSAYEIAVDEGFQGTEAEWLESLKGEPGDTPGSIPVGVIMAYVGTTAPSGWLMCTGVSIDSKYTQLRALVGSTTPNLKGRFLGGAGGNSISLKSEYDDSTRKPRKNNFSLSTGSGGSHSHSFSDSGTTGSGGGHNHRMGNTGQVSGDKSGGRFYPDTSGSARTESAGSHSHTFSVSGTTGNHTGHSHTVSSSNWDSYTRPHTYGVNYIIKHDDV